MAALFVSFSLMSGYAVSGDAVSASSLGVRSRSKSEIISYLNAHPFSATESVTFSSTPSTMYPYPLGAISQSSKTNGINALNCYRYIAGLSEVTWDSSRDTGMQAAAMVTALNGYLDHSPSKPLMLDAATYNMGYEYCGSSNLAQNPANLARSVERYILDESSSKNISTVGHRRWCLNPAMGQTCFGFVYTGNSESFSAMYAFDRSNSADSGIVNVAWPAQNTPISFFSSSSAPWSLSTGMTLNALLVSVRLTRVSDNKTWSFSSFSSDGYFNVDNGGYGLPGCIIFRPSDLSVGSGDTFQVHVETGAGAIEYNVNFFDVNSPGSDTPGSNPSTPSDPGSSFDVGGFLSTLVQLFVKMAQFFGNIGKWLLEHIRIPVSA